MISDGCGVAALEAALTAYMLGRMPNKQATFGGQIALPKALSRPSVLGDKPWPAGFP
jgi:hypothetical protein